MSDASSSFVHPGTQTLSHLDFNDMPCLDATERDPFSTYIALFADPPEQIQGYHGVPEWGDVSTQPLHSLLSPLADDELGDDVFCVTAADQSSQNSPSRSTESSSPQPANSIKSAGVGATLNKGARNSRKQNHSCDQCRAAKRACDLPQDVSINGQKPTNICTTCKRRGIECTVTWLVDRKSQRHNRKRPRTTSYIQTDSCVATCPEERKLLLALKRNLTRFRCFLKMSKKTFRS
jgi:hypothetical protein